MRDLGVQVSGDFKVSTQCLHAARKTNGALHQMRRAVQSRTPAVLVPLFKAFVRPHLEYCVQAWAPHLLKDIASLEAPKSVFTRLFRDIRDLSYHERLQALDLFSMERRRKRGDLIETFRILKGFTDIPHDSLFQLCDSVKLRGHSFKMAKCRSRLNIRAHFFTQRIVNDWNRLPKEVVGSSTVQQFKTALDSCWHRIFPESV